MSMRMRYSIEAFVLSLGLFPVHAVNFLFKGAPGSGTYYNIGWLISGPCEIIWKLVPYLPSELGRMDVWPLPAIPLVVLIDFLVLLLLSNGIRVCALWWWNRSRGDALQSTTA